MTNTSMDRSRIDRGAIFVVIFLVTALTLGYLMVGGTLPTKLPGYNNNLVNVVIPTPQPAKNNLQLYTFSGATITPYPTMAGGPLPAKSTIPVQQVDCNHVLTGSQEPGILWAYDLAMSPAAGNQLALRVFYDDEHALTLGAGNVSPMTKQPADHISKPNVGDLTQRDPNKLPFAPVVFLTDNTTNPSSNTGDGENNGTPLPPSDVFGSWKALGGIDPVQPNATNMGGADPWPASNGPVDTGLGGVGGIEMDFAHDLDYTSEILWKISDLKANGQALVPGHTYRAEFVIHDGDSTGDIGEACVNIQIPQAGSGTGGGGNTASPSAHP